MAESLKSGTKPDIWRCHDTAMGHGRYLTTLVTNYKFSDLHPTIEVF